MYKCDECILTFTCKSDLSRHKKIHKIANLQCSKCIMTFKYESTRARHERNKHDVATQNKTKHVLCEECNTYYREYYYKQHFKTKKHLSASVEHFNCQINFENFRIYPSSVYVTTTEFFNSIEQDFNILVKHLLLDSNVVVIDTYLFALYHKNSLSVVNKYIAEVQNFDVYNKKFTKNTDVHKMFKDIVSSFMFQSDALKTAEGGWILEEMLYVEIVIVNKLFDNEAVTSISLAESSRTNDPIITDNLQKTELHPYKRCNSCNVYIPQQNYEQHNKTIAHNISHCYLKNEKILINGVQWDNNFLRCRILSPYYFSIDNYFKSIEHDVLDLIKRILKLQNQGNVNVSIKMLGLYSHKDLSSRSIQFGDVKTYMLENEILSRDTIGLLWFQKISNTLKSYHQINLTSMGKSYYLANIMFLDLYFDEISNI